MIEHQHIRAGMSALVHYDGKLSKQDNRLSGCSLSPRAVDHVAAVRHPRSSGGLPLTYLELRISDPLLLDYIGRLPTD